MMADWQIGYAESDITPANDGTRSMAGFGRERYADGAVAPLRAQALYLADAAGRRSLLLTADVLHFDRTFVENLRRAIERATGLEAAAVMLAPSHTHWGPATGYRLSFFAGAPDPWYRKRLHEYLLALAVAASGAATPGRLSYAAADCQIGHNRRKPDGQGGLTWGPAPEKSYDRHTPILVAERAGDPATIILVGHACHPTSSGTIDKWTPDYPGAMRARIEEKRGGDTRAMFVMGCGADAKVTHVDRASSKLVFSASPAKAKAAGHSLASMVLKRLRGDLTPLAADLRCGLVTGKLTLAPRFPAAALEDLAYGGEAQFGYAAWAEQSLAFPDARKSLPYTVQAWRLGDALTLLGLEGEVCSPLGPLARALAQTPDAMTIGYTNATEGYIPSRTIVQEGGYEGNTSHRAYFLPAPFTEEVEVEFGRIVKRAVASVSP